MFKFIASPQSGLDTFFISATLRSELLDRRQSKIVNRKSSIEIIPIQSLRAACS
ncbi:MAG TPA: hypothetical protein PKK96_07725 [Anaerolineales bacterium]|nr:hypothetical protein [Anaerolineales bacterium]HMS00253.1 hypothetical protein [Anaerolineales bacterium]HNS60878.1 hypothetical protein [Anaerolineales bacterium]